MKKRESDYKPTQEMVKLLEYIMPHIEIAIDGKKNGHNFNSYFPADLKKVVPYKFYDLIWMGISQMAEWNLSENGFRKVKMDDLKFLDFTHYNWKWSQNGNYNAYKNGIQLLLTGLELTELYIEK